MRPIRTLAIAAAAVVAALILTHPLVLAEPQSGASAGTPLKLIPPPKRSASTHRAEETRQPHPTGARAASPADRLAARARSRGHVIEGPDSIDLIARLPWWRSPEMQTIRYPDKEFVSQVLATADTWYATVIGVEPASEDGVQIAAADEINELDLAADDLAGAPSLTQSDTAIPYIPDPPEQSWVQAILAMIGGAFAAVFGARVLFV